MVWLMLVGFVGVLTLQIVCTYVLLPSTENVCGRLNDLAIAFLELRGTLMAVADDLNAKLDAIAGSISNLAADVAELKDDLANAPGPDGSIPADIAQALLAKATTVADAAATAAGLFQNKGENQA